MKPCDAAPVPFALKFTDNIRYMFKNSRVSKARLQTYLCKIEFNTKWPFSVIKGHVFWSQWKGDRD